MNKGIRVTLVAFILALIMTVSALGADSLVTFKGHGKAIEFSPGSVYEDSDLFDDFKDVMPGDVLTEKISILHNGNERFFARVYMRSLGGVVNHEFLSKLHLSVLSDSKNLFDAPADETGALTEWTHIATISKGEWVDLDVILTVPHSLDNHYRFTSGDVEWEFMVEEVPKVYIPLTPAPLTEYIKYRVDANYYTDGVLDNDIPQRLLYTERAEKLPDIEKIADRYKDATLYGGKEYTYTSTKFDGESNTYTLRFDRQSEPLPDEPDEPDVPDEPQWVRYTVEAVYYTNGRVDAYLPLFASGDVEALPTELEIEALFGASAIVGGVEYKYTSTTFDGETNKFLVRFDRTVTPDEPEVTPPTGDTTNIPLWLGLLLGSLLVMALLLWLEKKKDKK